MTLAKEEKKAYLVSCGMHPNNILSGSSESDGSNFSDDTEDSLEGPVSDSDKDVDNNEFEEPQKKGYNHGKDEHCPPVWNCERDARPDDRWTVKPALDVKAGDKEIPYECLASKNNCKKTREEFEKAHKSDHLDERQETPEWNCWREPKPDASLKDTPAIDMDTAVVLDKLSEVSWNWFSVLTLLEEQFQNQGYMSAVFVQLLRLMTSQKPSAQPCFSTPDVNVSRQASLELPFTPKASPLETSVPFQRTSLLSDPDRVFDAILYQSEHELTSINQFFTICVLCIKFCTLGKTRFKNRDRAHLR